MSQQPTAQEVFSTLVVFEEAFGLFFYPNGDSSQSMGELLELISAALRLLPAELERRGIPSTNLLEISTQWAALRRQFPNPKDALAHFREAFDETETTRRIMSTTGRLKSTLKAEMDMPDRSSNDVDRGQKMNPFDDVEPHRKLPKYVRNALWRACQLVRAKPEGFVEAVSWLDSGYCEAALLVRELKTSRNTYCLQLRHLRKGLDPYDTFRRRKALRHGTSHAELMQQTINTARSRGLRLRGTECIITNDRQENDLVVNEDNFHLVWEHTDRGSREKIKEIRRDFATRNEECTQRVRDHVWRMHQAIHDAMEHGLPSGRNKLLHARRVVLLAYLVSWDQDCGEFGEFSRVKWDNEGHPFAFLVESRPWAPGRQSILFNPVHKADDKGYPFLVNVSDFGGLVSRAVSLLESTDAGSGALGTAIKDPRPVVNASSHPLIANDSVGAKPAQFGRRGNTTLAKPITAEPDPEIRCGSMKEERGAECKQEMYAFRCKGRVWDIRFEGAGDHVPEMKGLHHIQKLLLSPGKPISALELMGVDQSKIVISGDDGDKKLDREGVKVLLGRREGLKKQLEDTCGSERSKLVDEKQAIEEKLRKEVAGGSGLLERLERLERELDDTQNAERRAELDAQKTGIGEDFLKAVKNRGKTRAFQKTPHEQAADAVRAAINNVYKSLEREASNQQDPKKWEKLLAHLRENIKTGRECTYLITSISWSQF